MCETEQKPHPAIPSSVHIKNLQLTANEKLTIVPQQTVSASPTEEVKKEEPEPTKAEIESSKTLDPLPTSKEVS